MKCGFNALTSPHSKLPSSEIKNITVKCESTSLCPFKSCNKVDVSILIIEDEMRRIVLGHEAVPKRYDEG